MSNGSGNSPTGVGASRQTPGSSGFTTLGPAYETRRIVVAYGMQFHKDESLSGDTFQEFMAANFTPSADIEKISDTEYVNHLQGVRFTIEETIKRTEFYNFLKTPEIHLVYEGHARYGRGPCFGAHGLNATTGDIIPSEDWEQGSDLDSGIFRLGFPFLPVPANEILEHGYTANLLKESDPIPDAADCHPELRPYRHSMALREPEQIVAGLTGHLRGHQPGDRYRVYGSKRYVVHKAGWQFTLGFPWELGTLIDPSDPASTQMRCRVFTHLGCSTFIHNYPIVRRIAGWQHDGNERYAYWTTATSNPTAFGPWIHALITYNHWNAFQSWEPSLSYAVDRTNRYLRRIGQRYRVI
jgi:hypothetical protein